MAAGAVGLIASFLDFYTVPFGGGGVNVWSSGLFPAYTLMAVFAIVMAIQVALAKFTSLRPEPPLGFTWEQVHLVLGFFAMVYALAFLITDRPGLDLGIGFWGIVVACVAAFVGAVLLRRERPGIR
jgi:hypothetical protein